MVMLIHLVLHTISQCDLHLLSANQIAVVYLVRMGVMPFVELCEVSLIMKKHKKTHDLLDFMHSIE